MDLEQEYSQKYRIEHYTLAKSPTKLFLGFCGVCHGSMMVPKLPKSSPEFRKNKKTSQTWRFAHCETCQTTRRFYPIEQLPKATQNKEI